MTRLRFVYKSLLVAVLTACALVFYAHHYDFYKGEIQKPSSSQGINLMEAQQEQTRDWVRNNFVNKKPTRTPVVSKVAPVTARIDNEKEAKIDRLGQLFARDAKDWTPLNCDRNRKLRPISLKTRIGNLTIYIYDSSQADSTITARAVRGNIFEKREIEVFLEMTKDLPLIDVGANIGLVTLQAAMQGRQVVAVEPIPENAIRLCRAALDFGYGPFVHVINNAVSSSEGNVTLASDKGNQSTLFEVVKSPGWGKTPVTRFAILLDRLLEIVPFKRAALKIDVESHEGHVISGAHRLFQQMDIPLVWMEWEHVKWKPEFGGRIIVDFMRTYNMEPFNLMLRSRLNEANFFLWPFTVLWKRKGYPMPE